MSEDNLLDVPDQFAYRTGEARKAIEEKYRDSEEFDAAFVHWKRECLPTDPPTVGLELDLYLVSDEYHQALDSWIERWLAGHVEHD